MRPERLETLLFGVCLSPQHRAALGATAKLRQRQWHGEAIEEYQMAHAERADHHFGERRPSAPSGGWGDGKRSATLSALVPLAAFLGLVRTTSAASGSGGAAAGHAAGGAQPSSVASRKREAPSEAPEASGRARESG